MKTIFKLILYPLILILGLILFLITKKTYTQAYAGFRYLFVKTDGKINELLTSIIKIIKPKYDIERSSGLLGDLSNEYVNSICKILNTDGYYIFDQKFDLNKLEKIFQFSLDEPSSYLDVNDQKIKYSKEKIKFNPLNPISPRYQYEPNQLLNSDCLQEIIFDKNLLHIANNYLGSKPILDIITMWWSVPFGEKGQSQAAQMFHFDMDRIKFLKFFFYLTDVTTNTGPHCYIRGTNNSIPKQIRKDTRIADEELSSYFSNNDIVEINGLKGTIMAVDTRGLHKGKPLKEGMRLLFQIQFSNSLFGAPFDIYDMSLITKKEYLEQIKENRSTYLLFK